MRSVAVIVGWQRLSCSRLQQARGVDVMITRKSTSECRTITMRADAHRPLEEMRRRCAAATFSATALALRRSVCFCLSLKIIEYHRRCQSINPLNSHGAIISRLEYGIYLIHISSTHSHGTLLSAPIPKKLVHARPYFSFS